MRNALYEKYLRGKFMLTLYTNSYIIIMFLVIIILLHVEVESVYWSGYFLCHWAKQHVSL